MFEHLSGFWADIVDTASGRGQFRFLLQPTIAIILGIKFGIADAKGGRDPFLMRLLVKSKNRAGLLKETLRRIIVPFTIAIVLDGILQYLTHGYVRPVAALVIGTFLIFVPFAISRSLTNRIYRRRAQPRETSVVA